MSVFVFFTPNVVNVGVSEIIPNRVIPGKFMKSLSKKKKKFFFLTLSFVKLSYWYYNLPLGKFAKFFISFFF